ncbi:hypothetical protein [Candidatus Scalindua japonica]|uniref:hypothetical protein n=1 Tax=Candidatus Scalindua japonica TaxID=1284222 RepID=UPI0010547444|nr:hypothetical protein [Candidatus Scalindua japonica]
MIITGHQYDQTIRFAKLVLRRTLANAMSSVFATTPPTISSKNAASVISCKTRGNHQKRKIRFIGCYKQLHLLCKEELLWLSENCLSGLDQESSAYVSAEK